MEPPNVVLVHRHDLETYLGCCDAAVETPRIDALVAEGVRFDLVEAILDALEAVGLTDETLVVFTTEYGLVCP